MVNITEFKMERIMARNISFWHTKEQFTSETKTVTRRLGWKNLKPGDLLMGCEKVQGIKKGELKRLGLIRVLDVRQERLCDITDEDVVKEGFPDMTREEFISFFVAHMDCKQGAYSEVTRIEYEYLGEVETRKYLDQKNLLG